MEQASAKESITPQIATFAAGCFWGIEQYFSELEGVIETAVGYTGGVTEHPSYTEVCSGKTQHAEAVQLTINTSVISFATLLQHFWTIHDPTELNRQGLDIGTQYRSAIFFHNPLQKELALNSKIAAQIDFSRPIVTEIVPAETFWLAEEYHQKYILKRNATVSKLS